MIWKLVIEKIANLFYEQDTQDSCARTDCTTSKSRKRIWKLLEKAGPPKDFGILCDWI
jgi:hypothetical protein